jgi:molecular chaperone HtpG
MKETKTFKTESKQLLHLMTHSIYTHHEIFIRELISNASDAIDRRHFKSLTDASIPQVDYEIRLELDEANRTLKLHDTGLGMTESELEDNLGTIAKSGTKAFKETLEQTDDHFIGQFGVGFYSAFMVASKVEVLTKSPYSDTAFLWSSDGESEYSIESSIKDTIGTTITLYIREDAEEIDFSRFLKNYEIKSLIKKYSDYIRYPIKMQETTTQDGKEVIEDKVLNQMTPLWKREKSSISKEDMDGFIKHQFHEFEAPLKVIHTNVEGLLTYTALLFIPKKPAFNFYSESFEKGLQLYSKGVFIEDKNKMLIPDHFKFVKGLVDSSDLSLNISRELLQQDHQLKKIASTIEKKIKSELESMLKHEKELYIEFYDAYKLTLKYGVYDMYGMNKEMLQDLILFKTTKSDDYITFKEYVERKKDDQKSIYYVTGKSKAQMLARPQMDVYLKQDIEVLLCEDDVDEFMFQMIQSYDDLPFKSILSADSDIKDKTKEKEVKKQEKEYQTLLKQMKEALGDKVKSIKLSTRLTDAPVCMVSGDGVSLSMEKVLNQMPTSEKVKAERILEINGDHPLFQTIVSKVNQSSDLLKPFAELLYYQSLILEGLPIEDPKVYSETLTLLLK